MWWYRDRKTDGDDGDGVPSANPVDTLAAALGRILAARPKEPDRVVAMALLTGARVTVHGGETVGPLSSSQAEAVLDAACGGPQRLYNAYSRDFADGVPAAHEALLDEIRLALEAETGIASIRFGAGQ